MIVFDLQCSAAHVFEAWFGSSIAYEDQRTRGLLACPICGDDTIVKAVMAPNIAAKGNRAAASPSRASVPAAPVGPPPPAEVKTFLAALAKVQAKLLNQSKWVGRSFAQQARAMHDGDVAPTPIHGETTLAEAKALVEEGVAVAPLPLPFVPPEALN